MYRGGACTQQAYLLMGWHLATCARIMSNMTSTPAQQQRMTLLHNLQNRWNTIRDTRSASILRFTQWICCNDTLDTSSPVYIAIHDIINSTSSLDTFQHGRPYTIVGSTSGMIFDTQFTATQNSRMMNGAIAAMGGGKRTHIPCICLQYPFDTHLHIHTHSQYT